MTNLNTAKPYTVAVIIGRHQISHVGHELLKRKALEIAEHVVIVIGSAHQARSPRNPFTWLEREAMILSTLSGDEYGRVSCAPLRDYYNDERWNKEVFSLVKKRGGSNNVVLVGHKKEGDGDTYYLDNFPAWAYCGVESTTSIDASELRAIYFEASNIGVSLSAIADQVLPPVQAFLKAWALRREYRELADEHAIIKAEQLAWKGSPYPVIFSTADAVVRINNHVLLGRRKNYPGKGLWAIPSGFVEPNERVLHAALRELREETRIGLMTSSLMAGLKAVRVFDHPRRSSRGRVITHAHFFDLAGTSLPEIIAADDLLTVEWVSVDRLAAMESLFFDDHFHILSEFLKINAM